MCRSGSSKGPWTPRHCRGVGVWNTQAYYVSGRAGYRLDSIQTYLGFVMVGDRIPRQDYNHHASHDSIPSIRGQGFEPQVHIYTQLCPASAFSQLSKQSYLKCVPNWESKWRAHPTCYASATGSSERPDTGHMPTLFSFVSVVLP